LIDELIDVVYDGLDVAPALGAAQTGWRIAREHARQPLKRQIAFSLMDNRAVPTMLVTGRTRPSASRAIAVKLRIAVIALDHI